MNQSNRRSGTILIKYGGNAMLDDTITHQITEKVAELVQDGYQVVIVHGGGPFIQEILKMAGISSEFAGGHRKTTGEAMKYVEMALKGHVNGKLVRLLNSRGLKAIGISGKDGNMVQVEKRYHVDQNGNKVDIGFVGDIRKINVTLPELLLRNGFVPVIATISTGFEDGLDYNVNADIFAGYLAVALNVKLFIMMTNVDGLMKDPSDPSSLITEIKVGEAQKLYKDIIRGGMIPKTEACEFALSNGAEAAIILNGTKPERLVECVRNTDKLHGTVFVK